LENYEFVLPDDDGSIVAELERQEVEFQREFHLFVEKTVTYGWDRQERKELIDGQVETYVMELAAGDRRRVMLTRG
jgi:hypothetical protein